MQIAKVNCLLRLNQKGNVNLMSVVKCGPSAILVTEIPILRRLNDVSEGGGDDCCLSDVKQVGVVETTGNQEIARLKGIYGSREGNVVDAIYPGGLGLPKTIEDCELPATAMARPKEQPKAMEKA